MKWPPIGVLPKRPGLEFARPTPRANRQRTVRKTRGASSTKAKWSRQIAAPSGSRQARTTAPTPAQGLERRSCLNPSNGCRRRCGAANALQNEHFLPFTAGALNNNAVFLQMASANLKYSAARDFGCQRDATRLRTSRVVRRGSDCPRSANNITARPAMIGRTASVPDDLSHQPWSRQNLALTLESSCRSILSKDPSPSPARSDGRGQPVWLTDKFF
jgi:hypothetical protein